ncbi:hypothetical protein FSARC_8673 [Fusarium sarcochroum]|uniref:Fucose-specific lectin n=1 Tax=Fusarium sarcochroum TaxID=1208366 RepID=A0A8H4X6Q3_9HYPO|nr:hypothetical protein FSARC_8673 [Fusarium sarcochroum]
MAPITAVIDTSTSNDKVIKLFYNTGKAQLGLALWSATKDADPEDSIQSPQEVGNGQCILNPSHMTSVNYQGVERVFALTTANPFKVTRHDIYTLSEVSPLTFGIGRQLWEMNLQTSQSNSLLWTHDLWINSFAAAWYDTTTGKRSVIYESSTLVEYVVGDEEPGIHITPTGDMQRNTPVAAAFDAGTVYLYYCGRGAAGGIRRTIRTNSTWGNSILIGGHSIAQDSQLTVVRDNGVNHLFYVARDQDEEEDDYFVHYIDEI